MTSRTGSEGGFSLIELMLTVSFVLLGSLLIQGVFLRSAGVFGRYTHTLKAMDWSSRQTAEAREKLLSDDAPDTEERGGELIFDDRPFQWSQRVQSLGMPNLFSIRTRVSWAESGRPFEYDQEIYAYKKDATQDR